MESHRYLALVVVVAAICTLLPRLTLAAGNNIITFTSVDSTDRTVIFTPSVGREEVPSVSVAGGQTVDVVFPHGWVGKYLAVSDDEDQLRLLGVIGEVTFNGFGDMTYFDVSAIDDPSDQQGVRMLRPAGEDENTSGCLGDFPCDNAYVTPNDEQTKVTPGRHLIATLGREPLVRKEDGDDVDGGGRDDSDGEDEDTGDGTRKN
ncbi:uncharacterized protein PgNI_02780 [Pyricularia grisea]|uniref:DNase1 protein n=1 Tax=Pyricularia grisea TaxID=148305 RepID=A0A6P8BA45_PYRGI|nr:uncharacterized protein PgNI_02780 [Pyricularia grisea]TLD12557.1 hypothetical protein PgNI_02780 [Pyricularia grisea]